MTDHGQVEIRNRGDGPEQSGALYFLTNRMNLNTVLAARLVAPRESYQKYYADLLDLCPGWVPLLAAPPSAALLDSVDAERGSGGAALIEFPADALHTSGAVGAVVFARGVALASATAIHLPSERSLREHRARRYGNIHPHDELLRVTPELFTGDQVDAVVEAPEGRGLADWTRLDRVRGAMNAVVTAASTPEELALAAALLGAPDLSAKRLGRTWPALDDTAPENGSGVSSADSLTFQVIYHVLLETDATSRWVPEEIVDRVARDMSGLLPAPESVALVTRNLERVRELVRAEAAFEPFRDTGSALSSAKALILLLLRPDLSELLSWPAEVTGADGTTRTLAAAMAGRLRGLSRESVGVRTVVFDDLTARWATRVASDPNALLGSVTVRSDGQRTSLMVDGISIRTVDGQLEAPTEAGSSENVEPHEVVDASAPKRNRDAGSGRI